MMQQRNTIGELQNQLTMAISFWIAEIVMKISSKQLWTFLYSDYKPEYERLKKERLAEVAAEQQKQLDRLKKDIAQGGDSSIPINTGCMYTHVSF